MFKIFIFSISCLLVFPLMAQNKTTPPKKPELQITYADIVAKAEVIGQKILKIKFPSSISEPFPAEIPSASEYEMYASIFDYYAKHPNIEEKTEIYRTWYVKVTKELKGLATCRDQMGTAFANKDAKRYDDAKKLYEQIIPLLKETLEKPAKMPRSDYLKMLEQKRKK